MTFVTTHLLTTHPLSIEPDAQASNQIKLRRNVMAEITAAAVKALREKTDLPMMECKKALVEAGGDEARAVQILQAQFEKVKLKRADNVTNEGRIFVALKPDGSEAAIAPVVRKMPDPTIPPMTRSVAANGPIARSRVVICRDAGWTTASYLRRAPRRHACVVDVTQEYDHGGH